MNLSYISSEDWQTLFNKYPFVEDYLVTFSLKGELKALRAEKETFGLSTFQGRVDWVNRRISELENIENILK